MIGSELLRYKPDQLYAVVDVESEGLNLATSRPWQLACAIGTLKQIQTNIVRHINWPNLHVSEAAARVTRFNMGYHLKIAEPPETIVADFDEVLYDPNILIVGHNILGFDIYLLDMMRRLTGRKQDWSFLPRIIDTNALMKAYKKGFVPTGDRLTFMYKALHYREKGLKSSLGFCCRDFGIPYDERRAHDAAYDIGVNFAVLEKLIWSVEI